MPTDNRIVLHPQRKRYPDSATTNKIIGYLADVSAVTREAAFSRDPELIEITLKLLHMQARTIRHFAGGRA